MAKKKDDQPIWDWKKDLEEWVDDVKQALPSGDGHTIYPEKLSLQKGEHEKVSSITQVLVGRAGAFRRCHFHLPMNERWSIEDDEKCVIIDSGFGWLFTVAKGLRTAIVQWANDLVETGVMSIQDTLSDEYGYAVFSIGPKTTDLPFFWYGRPKRAGARYVLAMEKEGVWNK